MWYGTSGSFQRGSHRCREGRARRRQRLRATSDDHVIIRDHLPWIYSGSDRAAKSMSTGMRKHYLFQ